MNTKSLENGILTDFILDYSDRTLSTAEEKSFTELMASSPKIRKTAFTNWFMSNALKRLNTVKTRDGFDQRMAAAFCLEVERETGKLNSDATSKKKLIN